MKLGLTHPAPAAAQVSSAAPSIQHSLLGLPRSSPWAVPFAPLLLENTANPLYFGQKRLEANPRVCFGRELRARAGRRPWDDKHLPLPSRLWHCTFPWLSGTAGSLMTLGPAGRTRKEGGQGPRSRRRKLPERASFSEGCGTNLRTGGSGWELSSPRPTRPLGTCETQEAHFNPDHFYIKCGWLPELYSQNKHL